MGHTAVLDSQHCAWKITKLLSIFELNQGSSVLDNWKLKHIKLWHLNVEIEEFTVLENIFQYEPFQQHEKVLLLFIFMIDNCTLTLSDDMDPGHSGVAGPWTALVLVCAVLHDGPHVQAGHKCASLVWLQLYSRVLSPNEFGNLNTLCVWNLILTLSHFTLSPRLHIK